MLRQQSNSGGGDGRYDSMNAKFFLDTSNLIPSHTTNNNNDESSYSLNVDSSSANNQQLPARSSYILDSNYNSALDDSSSSLQEPKIIQQVKQLLNSEKYNFFSFNIGSLLTSVGKRFNFCTATPILSVFGLV